MPVLEKNSNLFTDIKILFFGFLKENGLFKSVYKHSEIVGKWLVDANIITFGDISNLVLDWSGFSDRKERMVMSQLWRFFILDHLGNLSGGEERVKALERFIRWKIETNGDKGDERLKKKFKEYCIYENYI